MAAVAATLFAHLGPGDHVIVGDELFAITQVLLDEDFPRLGIDVSAVDMTDMDAVAAQITPDHAGDLLRDARRTRACA